MKQKLNSYYNTITGDQEIFIGYLKAKYPLFHNSVFFFRDLQYGIRSFLEHKGIEISYPEAEELAKKYADDMQNKGIFIPINHITWKINMPEHATAVPGDPF